MQGPGKPLQGMPQTFFQGSTRSGRGFSDADEGVPCISAGMGRCSQWVGTLGTSGSSAIGRRSGAMGEKGDWWT